MNALLTAAAFLVLVAVAAYVIHRLNLQHADRIAAYRYSAPLPGRRGRGTPQPPAGQERFESPSAGERRDRRDGAAATPRRRSRTTRHG
ncbi:hypothetical protein BU52_16145 [Streptomyces toyocaensis]|uniref:Uncharacterized protein n=1 Tax=Streptomyces toyocaensis TaxID=55952 RepID=A0A081XRT5_STRTO|nr:hypothetical protein [Streptomyces toyocaensis]KES06258.1 hypothetical protein BU52_16145 [Streptomyces toyocaensis]